MDTSRGGPPKKLVKNGTLVTNTREITELQNSYNINTVKGIRNRPMEAQNGDPTSML